MDSSLSPAELIEDIHLHLDQAIERIDRGDYVELATILPNVEALCRILIDLPVPEAMRHRAAIDKMVERLDEVKQLMEQHKAQVGEQVKSLGGGKAAAKAYWKSSHLPKAE